MRKERETQNRVIELFREQLGYHYIGNLEKETNSNIREASLRAWLERHYSSQQAAQAIQILQKEAAMESNGGLYEPNKAVYHRLRYGISLKEKNSEPRPHERIYLIDWEQPENNVFEIAEEVTVKGKNTKRPDIVLYINGIAIGVLELKRASVSVSEGIRQNLDNQSAEFIRPFFSTIQLVLAGNDSQGLYYGTTGTAEKFFLRWKEDKHDYQAHEAQQQQNLLDQQLSQFCQKSRLLEIIHDFVIFDAGIKKLCRPNQYFGVKAAQDFIRRRAGGIIWHTQGSGKSLTMVWLAKWIKATQTDARVLIVTDRTELDEQIEKVFKGVEENIQRSKSGQDLITLLDQNRPPLLCSLVHKFGKGEEASANEFANELQKLKTSDFSPKGNIFVFIDECHRTQSGSLHRAMKELLPDALFIGFTGTPLLKTDKQKSIEVFGPYIHTYKFNEAVADNVVLDLLYEARDVNQKIMDKAGLDAWFDQITQGMNELPKAELKKQWGTIQNVLSSKDRLQQIAIDIIKDFKLKPRLNNGRGNAILVSSSIYEACRYYSLFQDFGFKKCAVITSFQPNANSIKGESTGAGDTEKQQQYETYIKMLGNQDLAEFERQAKKQFIDQPAEMQLLIVVDKLLTGFDAPSCTYLYIDKDMRDHGLFQAICRVNRTDQEDKDFGYIVDYKNLFNSLNQSITDYTSEAFDAFDTDDVEGLLVNRLEKAKNKLEDCIEALHEITKHVALPQQIEQYAAWFCSTNPSTEKDKEPLRLIFYKAVAALVRAYANIAPEIQQAGYSPAEAQKIKQQVNEYVELRDALKMRSGDFVDLKKLEPEMRQMLDMYLQAEPSRKISDLGGTTLVQLIAEKGAEFVTKQFPLSLQRNPSSVAETLEANMRKVITQEMPMNPVYYEQMSLLLDELIEARKQKVLDYREQLKKMEELAQKVQQQTQANHYPAEINTPLRQAFYDQLGGDTEQTLALEEIVKYKAEDEWTKSRLKTIKLENALKKEIQDEEQVNKIMNILKNHGDDFSGH